MTNLNKASDVKQGSDVILIMYLILWQGCGFSIVSP